ncbi:hypothetical protein C1Y03_10345, partial [Pseudomonas sp. FW306-02-H05-AA]
MLDGVNAAAHVAATLAKWRLLMTAQVTASQTHAPVPDLDKFNVDPTVGDDDLDSFGTIRTFGALIPTDKLLPDDMIYVEMTGEPGTPEGGKSKSRTVLLGPRNPRLLNLDNEVVAFILGKKMLVTYTILREGEIDKTSDPLILNVLPLPRNELKAARIIEAQDNGHGPELDLTSNTAECTVRLGDWPLRAKNQRCWVYLKGKNAGGDYLYPVMESEPVDEDWLTQGYRKVKVPYDYFKALLNGSLLKVFVKVALNQVDDETQAFDFEERVYTVKNVEVAKPEITTVTDLKGVEISNPGTTKYTTVKLKGRAEPNQLLDIFDGELIVGNPTADEQGDWEHRLERLKEKDYEIFVEGPKGLTSDGWEFRVEELQAPTIDTVKDSKGEPVGEGETTLDGDLKVEGKAEDGYEVEIFDGKTSVALLRVYGGIWELRKSFSNREHVLKAVGRYGDDRPAESAPRSFTVAVQASKPTIEKVTDSNGKPVPHGSKTRDTRVKLEGTALPYQELKVFDGEQHIDSVTTGKDGVWLCELIDLSQSEHPIRVEVRPGVDSGVWSFTVVELVKPTIDEVKDVAGTTIGDTVTTNKTPLTLNGTVAAGNQVDMYDGASKLGVATMTGSTTWEFKTQVLSLKTYVFKAVEQGVGGPESATRTVTVTAVVKPTIDGVKDVAGTTIGDTVTTNKTPLTLNGTVAAGNQVDMYDGASKLGVATMTGSTTWEFKTQVLSLKTYAFKAVEQGVGGPESATRTVTVTAVVKPTIDGVKDAAGTTIGDTVTTNKTPLTLNGTVAAGNQVDMYDGASKLGVATMTGSTTWEFKTQVLSLKTYAFKAVEQGVGGPESATRTVT